MLGFQDFLMKDLQEILTSLQHVLVDILRVPSGHAMVPKVDDYEYVLHSHLLKECEQLLPTPFFIAIIVTFHEAILGKA